MRSFPNALLHFFAEIETHSLQNRMFLLLHPPSYALYTYNYYYTIVYLPIPRREGTMYHLFVQAVILISYSGRVSCPGISLPKLLPQLASLFRGFSSDEEEQKERKKER